MFWNNSGYLSLNNAHILFDNNSDFETVLPWFLVVSKDNFHPYYWKNTTYKDYIWLSSELRQECIKNCTESNGTYYTFFVLHDKSYYVFPNGDNVTMSDFINLLADERKPFKTRYGDPSYDSLSI